jgi:hypothetical protein
MQASCVLSPQARKLPLPEASGKPRARPVETDARTHMLLAKPIASTILRLAVPNSTVMIVQILIGLLEVYFVSTAPGMTFLLRRLVCGQDRIGVDHEHGKPLLGNKRTLPRVLRTISSEVAYSFEGNRT